MFSMCRLAPPDVNTPPLRQKDDGRREYCLLTSGKCTTAARMGSVRPRKDRAALSHPRTDTKLILAGIREGPPVCPDHVPEVTHRAFGYRCPRQRLHEIIYLNSACRVERSALEHRQIEEARTEFRREGLVADVEDTPIVESEYD